MMVFIFVVGILVMLAAVGIQFVRPETEDSIGRRRTARDYGRDEPEAVRYRFPLAGSILIGAVGAALILISCMRVIKATEVGVPVTLGKAGEPLDSGLQFVAPWTKVSRFSTTFQVVEMTGEDAIVVNGSDGGTMSADVAVRFAVKIGGEGCSVQDLFQRVRSQDRLKELVIRSDTREITRNVFNRRPAFVGYTTDREAVSSEANTELGVRLAESCVQLDYFLLRGIRPSDQVQTSINNAIAANAQIETARANAESARQEAQGAADARVIAAKGQLEAAEKVAAANRELDSSLTPEVLRLRYIEALRDSQNRIIITDGTDADVLVDTRQP